MSEYNIQMNKYNALNVEYDQLYPATKIENVDGLNTALQNKADTSSVYSKEESISAETRTALGLEETATPDSAFAKIVPQLSGTVESTDYPGCYYRMVDGVVEWINPPMSLGVEYRTTERYTGKPVYIKLVDFGSLPNHTFKTVYITESEKTIPIWFEGKLDTHNQVMRDGFLPANNGAGGNYLITTVSFTGNEIGGIFVKTTMDMTGFTAKVLVKYIKMAD